MSIILKCDKCGVEVNDPNQEICEICGGAITTNELIKETTQNPTVIRNVSDKKTVIQRRRHRCC